MSLEMETRTAIRPAKESFGASNTKNTNYKTNQTKDAWRWGNEAIKYLISSHVKRLIQEKTLNEDIWMKISLEQMGN